MQTEQEQKKVEQVEITAPLDHNDLIAKQILQRLGRPIDVQRVQVRWLWENHYRVNVFIGNDIVSARVAHSYFLIADNYGNIVASTPELRRLD